MCWVIPPASVATTADSRIASRSVVLPWSTCPMMVTTGGRACSDSGASSNVTSSASSSAACWIVISRFSSSPISSTASSLSDCVICTMSPAAIIVVMILAGETPRFSARSLTVMPDGTLTGPVGTSASRRSTGRWALRSLLGPGQLAVRGDAAVAAALERLVRAALAGGRDGDPAAGELALLLVDARVRLVRLLGVVLRLGHDVDAPPGEAVGETGVQPLLADRQRKLAVGHDDGRLAVLVVHVHLAHLGRRERLGDEPGRLVVPGDDVDLLAAELGDDHSHSRPAWADARAHRVDALGLRFDRDLGAIAGLARHGADLDEAVSDLGHLELEELADQLVGAARQHHLGALALGAHLDDDRLDPASLLVALARHLLGAGQDGLHPAQVDERVPVVVLLDDPGDDLTDTVGVLVVHHRPLGLVDPLAQHLLRGLAGDAAEVLGRDVDQGVPGEPVPLDLRLRLRLLVDWLLVAARDRLGHLHPRPPPHPMMRMRLEVGR